MVLQRKVCFLGVENFLMLIMLNQSLENNRLPMMLHLVKPQILNQMAYILYIIMLNQTL